MVEAHATAKYVRTSAQKAGLVLDLIRGKDVNRALAALKYARKSVAEDIAKVLRSAIANADVESITRGETGAKGRTIGEEPVARIAWKSAGLNAAALRSIAMYRSG